MLRAMIVDDEAPARSELRFLLEETGRVDAIVEASSARDAVEKLMDGRPDVLFLDVSMPKTNGMQLAEALHKLKNPPAVVFVTAYSEYALEAFDVDAVDYLMKGGSTECFNLGTGLGLSVREILETAEKVTGKKIPVRYGPRREGDPPRLIANPAKAKEILGWEAQCKDANKIVETAWKWMTGPRGGHY